MMLQIKIMVIKLTTIHTCTSVVFEVHYFLLNFCHLIVHQVHQLDNHSLLGLFHPHELKATDTS